MIEEFLDLCDWYANRDVSSKVEVNTDITANTLSHGLRIHTLFTLGELLMNYPLRPASSLHLQLVTDQYVSKK